MLHFNPGFPNLGSLGSNHIELEVYKCARHSYTFLSLPLLKSLPWISLIILQMSSPLSKRPLNSFRAVFFKCTDQISSIELAQHINFCGETCLNTPPHRELSRAESVFSYIYNPILRTTKGRQYVFTSCLLNKNQ